VITREPSASAEKAVLQIMVTYGMQPGQTVQVQAPDGRTLQVQVPPGVVPGQMISVQA